MKFPNLILPFCGLLFFTHPASASPEEDMNQAKSFLKERLKQLAIQFPFLAWEKKLYKCQLELDRLKLQYSDLNQSFDSLKYASMTGLQNEVKAIVKHRAEVNLLVRELYATSLVASTEAKFSQAGKIWDIESKHAFQAALSKYEAGSIKPKSIFLANAAALDREFRALQVDIQFAFAKEYLGRRVESHLKTFEWAKIEALYADYSLQLNYWNRSLESNASQTHEQLSSLTQKFTENKLWLKKNLQSLVEVLNTEMLFSDLLEYAAKQKVEFTLEVEEKFESSLKEQNQATLAPIQERIQLWKRFALDLNEKTLLAEDRAQKQKHIAMAKEEVQRIEDLRLQELQAEQQKADEERKAKIKETLTALRTFSFKSETSVSLDEDAEKALATQAGFLKTSYVSSGSNKIKIEKQKFSDTLARVQKFTVEDGQLDFSKMTLQERSNQSAYTYASPEGRTSPRDLVNFVSEVAMGSFSSFYTFLSYVTPTQWKVGRAFAWMAERGTEKVAQDREFSYVDLVVDAHRKRSGNGSSRTESTLNLPANMVLILDPQGAVKRFQSFADIGQVFFQSGDLVNGKVYYKFLNYSTDRQHIYLNGIDGEIKVAVPIKS